MIGFNYAPFIFTGVFSKSAKLPLPAPENPLTGQIRYPIIECFNNFDLNGNERISLDELWQGLTSEDGLGPDVFGPGNFVVNPTTFTKETIYEAFEQNDLSEYGQLTINEFVNVLISFLKESMNEEQLKFNKIISDDNPDAVETDRSFLEYRTRKAFESADVDRNGFLTEHELMMFMNVMIKIYDSILMIIPGA